MILKTRYAANGKNVPIPARVAERAATRYQISGNCWISNYSVASHGYAQIGWDTKAEGHSVVGAHRAAWTHHNGPIPDGLTIDHLCRQRRCVNPDHLRLLTNVENASDNGMKPHRDLPAGWDCRNCGNPIVRVSNGSTTCRQCARARKRRKREAC